MKLEDLGITQDELCERLVTKLAAELLQEEFGGYDDGGELVTGARPTAFANEAHKLVRERIDAHVKALAEKHLLPRVDKLIETVVLEQTNQWGEKTGTPPVSLKEYLVQRAEAYLLEPVDYQGNPTQQSSYHRNDQTRITHLVNKHFHYTIEDALKTAIKAANLTLAEGLHKTCKLKLAEIADKLQITIAPAR